MTDGYDGRHGYERHASAKDVDHCRFVDEDFIYEDFDTTHKWTATVVGAGGCGCQSDRGNGVMRMTTGAIGNNSNTIDMNGRTYIDPTLLPLMVFIARMLSVADENMEVHFGMVDVLDTDHCIFTVDRSVYGDLSINAEAYNGGGQTRDVDTGVVMDTTWRIFEIYIDETGLPYWYIDGVPVVTGEAADVDPTEYFQPYARVETENANAKSLELDLIRGWQRRSLTV